MRKAVIIVWKREPATIPGVIDQVGATAEFYYNGAGQFVDQQRLASHYASHFFAEQAYDRYRAMKATAPAVEFRDIDYDQGSPS